VRAPGTTEDLIPEAVDEVVMVEEASYMNGASSGTLEEFVAYATITVESALDVVEIATTCRAQHYSISGAGSAYLVLAYRENPSGSFTEMALPLEKTTAVGTYERMSGVASVTGLTPDTYDFGLMNHSEETIGGEYGILSVENTVAVVRMKR
jgi:hypothetical protein